MITNLRRQIEFGLTVCILFSSCMKKYKFTAKVCDKNLFVEVYQINYFGVDADYLTDSTNFRKHIGDWDEEHENYSYSCKGDSVYIMKTVSGNRWAKWDSTAKTVISNFDTIQNLTFSISQLKKENNYK